MLPHLTRWFPRPLDSAQLGERGHVRMLELTHQRLVLSICAMPLLGIPFTLWFQGLGRNPLGMLAWTILYALGAAWLLVQARSLQRSRAPSGSVADSAWLARWQPVVRTTSLVHALGIASLGAIVLLTPGRANFDFVLLLHVSLAVVIVGNATFQLPSVGMFLRFYGLGWGIVTVVLPLALTQWPSLLGAPGEGTQRTGLSPWPFIVPMSLLLLIALYRHAVVAHNFFLQQVRLEEEGVRLAQEAQQAHEEAEQALRATNIFLSTASHDLRQPVHAMGFQIESIARRNHDPALLPALEDLRRSVKSVHLMFNSLLDLSRIESGTQQAQRLPVLLAPLLNEVAMVFREEATSRGLALRVRLVAQDATVQADPQQLHQSLVNLVHNALRYTQRGGVLLAVRRRGAQWRIEVWDTGVGVALQDRDQIYQPFYRPQHAWHIQRAGHGLGLAVVARCADMMGARHGLQSRLGRGSCFWMQLPALAPAEHHPAHGSGAAPLERTQALQGQCLVLDDDPNVLSAWNALLTSWCLQGRFASNAAEAFAHIDAGFAPDVVLCDQRLRSGESGFDVLRALLERCPDARGAMVSGEFDAPELRDAQAQGYLVLRKPVDVAELHAVLSLWLRPLEGE